LIQSLLQLDQFQFLQFKPCTLKLDSGCILGVSGVSGSGKSLFLRALADLIPNSGGLCFRGQALLEFSPPVWRAEVCYLVASSAWWFDTVGPHCKTWDFNALSALGFEAGVMDWPISRLSTGEKQRLAFVRSLSHQPSVLLLDEPTASLDSQNQQQFEALLSSWVADGDRAAVLVSHDEGQLGRVSSTQYRIHNQELELV